MIITDLVSRVTLLTMGAILAVAMLAAWLAGPSGAVGTGAGGGIALLDFRWLARGVRGAALGQRRGGAALAGVGLRHIASFAALALALSSGWAHPLAVIAGVSVLPPVLIAQGLSMRAAD